MTYVYNENNINLRLTTINNTPDFSKLRYAEDFEDDFEVNGKESNQEDNSFDYDDDEDENALIPEKRAWLYEQALRGQARQRVASQLQAVLRRYDYYI